MRFSFPSPARIAALVVAAAALGACSARDGGGLLSTGAADTDKKQYTVADFAKSTYCPPVEIRGGTETMTTYERGRDNEPAYVRTQASMTKTARECRLAGTTLSIKLGVSGRVVAGPKGGPGTVTLPVRVAVVKQVGAASPMFSQLYKVPVTLSAGNLGTNYNQVFDNITVEVGPQDRNLLVFVGFDEGK